MHSNRFATRLWHAPLVRSSRHLASPQLWFRYLTASRRRLPTMIIAGAQKAGTTSLFGYLRRHPQCAASSTKEVHYFDRHFARGEKWYRMHFPLAEPYAPHGAAATTCFESSPYYMFDPRAPQRIGALVPEVKVIFLLRNPVSRAFSHYQHCVRRGREPLSFEEALDAEPERLRGEHDRLLADPNYQSEAHQHFSYAARGIYVDQLQRWCAHFPREQMLVLQSERMFGQPHETLAEVLRFLQLDPWSPPGFGNLYAGRYRSSMLPATRKRLARHFAEHNERLFEHLGTRYAWDDAAAS